MSLRQCHDRVPWWEAYWNADKDAVVHFLECPECRLRTAAYAEDDVAIGDWNEGKVAARQLPQAEGGK